MRPVDSGAATAESGWKESGHHYEWNMIERELPAECKT